MQVNHRYVRTTTPATFDALVEDLREGKLDSDVPSHGTLIRVRRSGGLRAPRQEIVDQRARSTAARAQRAEEAK